jgi:hypothetical protein
MNGWKVLGISLLLGAVTACGGLEVNPLDLGHDFCLSGPGMSGYGAYFSPSVCPSSEYQLWNFR